MGVATAVKGAGGRAYPTLPTTLDTFGSIASPKAESIRRAALPGLKEMRRGLSQLPVFVPGGEYLKRSRYV